MISKLCQSLDWEYLVYWAIPCIDSCLRAKGKLWHSLFYPLFESGWKLFSVCLCTESWDQREGWSGCWGLIKQFWILTGSSRTIDIPHPSWWPTTQSPASLWGRFSLIPVWIHIAPFSGTKLLNLALTGTYSKWKSFHWGCAKMMEGQKSKYIKINGVNVCSH